MDVTMTATVYDTIDGEYYLWLVAGQSYGMPGFDATAKRLIAEGKAVPCGEPEAMPPASPVLPPAGEVVPVHPDLAEPAPETAPAE